MIKIIPDPNNRKTVFKLSRITRDMRLGIKTALYEIGAENTQQVKKYIYAPPKTGRYYRFRGRWHRASAPGQSPATRSGYLARSINYHVSGYDNVTIFSTAVYAAALEYGHTWTKGGVTRKLLPRPYFIRAKNKKERDNYRSLERHVFDRLKGKR